MLTHVSTDAGSEDGCDTIKQTSMTDDRPNVNDTGVSARDADGNPIQVRLDYLDDLPDVNSAEAAHTSSVRWLMSL